jgi:biotin carboxylase
MAEHIIVIHRWRDNYALYGRYIDHGSCHVSYISTAMGRRSVPAQAAAVVTVAASDDLGEVRRAARSLTARFGPAARVVALNEGDLDTAAFLRAELGCPGLTPDELARFRDKLTMAQAVAAAGIRIPAFADAPDPQAVSRFAEANGWPVVVKPRRGTASRDVMRLDSAAELPALRNLPLEPRLAEVFCGDPIYHVDGLWTGTRLGPWRASRYLNTTCVGFNNGDVLGSVEVDDPDLIEPLGTFAAAVAAALSDQPWVFHLEVFVGSAQDRTPRLTFLEVGYRAGGAEIPFIWREVHGMDLMAAAAAVQLGREPELANGHRFRVGGWLLVPTPVATPCRVVASELPASANGGPYAHVIPPVGYLVPRAGGYEHVGARFRFKGENTHEVEKAIMKTAVRFRLECVAE